MKRVWSGGEVATYVSPRPCHTTRGRNSDVSVEDEVDNLDGTTARGC